MKVRGSIRQMVKDLTPGIKSGLRHMFEHGSQCVSIPVGARDVAGRESVWQLYLVLIPAAGDAALAYAVNEVLRRYHDASERGPLQ